MPQIAVLTYLALFLAVALDRFSVGRIGVVSDRCSLGCHRILAGWISAGIFVCSFLGLDQD